MNTQKLGQRLKKQRKASHLTGEQLAEKTNLSAIYIRQLESGLRLPSLSVFVDLVNALDCTADALLADSVAADSGIVLSEITKKLQGLSPERLAEISAVIDAMVGYMKKE